MILEPERRVPPFVGEGRPSGEAFCIRWLGDGNCGKPASIHVCWDETMENAPCCPEHWAEAQEKWEPYDHHPFEGFCGMPDTLWHFSWDQPTREGFCSFPLEDEETVEAVVSAEVDEFMQRQEVLS